jgi:uncharacterized membrane protein (UPF0127 family)
LTAIVFFQRLAAPLLALLLLLVPPAVAADGVTRLPTEPLVIDMAGGGKVTFETEIADDDAERSRGLMFRRSMQEHEAMLFIWPAPYEVGMWMRNTYIPLDMLFIAADGKIVHIARETVPHSLDVITAGQKVLAVLEISGGAAARFGISPGDQVRHRFFAAP